MTRRISQSLRDLLTASAIVLALSGCPQQPETTPTPSAVETPPAPVVGGDRDAHGCIASAGYAWCERERACVRSWELAKEKGFENDAEAFRRYCESPTAAGMPTPAPTHAPDGDG